MFRLTFHLARLLIAVAITTLLTLAARAQAEAHTATEPTAAQVALVAKRGAPAAPMMIGPIVWSALAEPIRPVKGTDGRIHLIYELHVTNAAHLNARVRSIEPLDARDHSATGANRVLSPGGADLTGQVRPFSLTPTQGATNYTNRLGDGQSGVVYFDVTYDDARQVPKQIKHRFIVALQIPEQDDQVFTVIGDAVKVSAEEPTVIAPPLKGNNWVVANGAGPIISPHRFTVQPTNGRLRVPEHFAIDFIQLNAEGRLYTGDPAQLGNWTAYGAEVIAATPGKVIAAVNNLPDQIPGEPLPPVSADTVAGNHVIVDVGNGRYALYAHLVPGSLAVGVGDFVQPGQPLGRLGNSGNSTGPHLHFQITDAPSALNANGLPFVFDRMLYQGRLVGSLDEVNDVLFDGDPPTLDTREGGPRALLMPLTLNLIGFR